MTKTVVLLHGAWMTPACWDPFRGYLEKRGYTVIAPAWPGKDRPVEEIRRDPSPLAGLGGAEIVEHFASIVAGLDEPPILIGHSFGGLFTQLLLSRGLGAAGIAIDSAPPRGPLTRQLSAYRSLGAVVANPANRRRVVRWTFEQFRYAFAHTLPEADVRALYDEQVTPETGRIFFQVALSAVHVGSPFVVDYAKPDRAPLLLVAGEDDHIVPASLNRANHHRYRHSPARTDFVEFAERTHWIIGQPGWEEVAAYCADWAEAVTG